MKNLNKDQKKLESIKEIDGFINDLLDRIKIVDNQIHNHEIDYNNAEGLYLLVYFNWMVIFFLTASFCILPKENLSEALRTFLPIGAVETAPLVAVVTNLVIKTRKLSDKIKGLEGKNKRLYERVEKLNQEKKELDLSLIRDGVDISVLSERYASVLSERNSIEEDEKEKIQEKNQIINGYKNRINTINNAIESVKPSIKETQKVEERVYNNDYPVYDNQKAKALFLQKHINSKKDYTK